MSTDEIPLDVTEISDPDQEFLEAVEKNDGEATTTILRAETDLTRSQIHYRIDKFDESGLIEASKPSKKEGNRPTQLELTELGQDTIDSGLLEKSTRSRETVQELIRQVQTLRARLEAVEVNTSTDPAYVFTEQQRWAIQHEVESTVSINERTNWQFFDEIFPTIAEELGYPAPPGTPPGEHYNEQFEYPMRDANTGRPAGKYPNKDTIADRLEQVEERLDRIEDRL